ncbi:structural maintenance of chromosomes 3, partial [Reticulomyxa filosa]
KELEKTIESLETEGDKLSNELASLRGEETKRSEDLKSAQSELNKSHEKRKHTKNELKDIQTRENESNKTVKRLQQDVERHDRELRNTMSLGMYEAYIECRRVVDKYKDSAEYDLKGIYGPVLELFSCAERYDQAIEECAKHKLFYWVCDNDDTATTLITLLKKEKCGRVTLMPLNRILERQRKKPRREYPNTPDCVPIMRLLEFDRHLEPAFDQIFGQTLIARDLETGFDYALRYGFDMMTLEGDKVTLKGAFEGGHADEKNRRLTIMRRLKELKKDLDKEHKQLDTLQGQRTTLESRLDSYRLSIEQHEHTIRECYNELKTLGSRVAHFENEIKTQDKLRSQKQELLKQSEELAHILATKFDELNAEMATDLQSQMTAEEIDEMERLHSELDKLKEECAHAIEERSHSAMRKHSLQASLQNNLFKQRDNLKRLCQDLQNSDFVLRENLERVNTEMEQCAEKKNELQTHVQDIDKEIDTLDKTLAALENELEKVKQKEAELGEIVANENKATEKKLGKTQALREKLMDLNKRLADLGAIPSTKLLQKFENKSVKQLEKIFESTMSAWKALDHKKVNQKAVEQYKSFNEQKVKLSERHSQQTQDKDHIYGLIGHLDSKKEDAIFQTFEAVNEKFSGVFRELVPRGKASLVIYKYGNENEMSQANESDDKSNKCSGVGIRASFSGVDQGDDNKRDDERNMAQLSGGQQSVVSLGLIFAMQRCDPAPFYVFDEIDAALDTQYRRAVAQIIGTEKQQSQFIVTTFRPELLDFADKFVNVEFRNKISTASECDVETAKNVIQAEQTEHLPK